MRSVTPVAVVNSSILGAPPLVLGIKASAPFVSPSFTPSLNLCHTAQRSEPLKMVRLSAVARADQ